MIWPSCTFQQCSPVNPILSNFAIEVVRHCLLWCRSAQNQCTQPLSRVHNDRQPRQRRRFRA